MGLTTATLAGHTATDARVSISAWGAAYADVSLDSEVTLTGRVSLVVADLTLSCTVLSGGPAAGRSFYRLVAGAGGWGKTLPRKSYANDAGVKLATVLGDAAAAVGEILDLTSFDPTTRLGPAWTRPEGPACALLELLSPGAWYVDADGVTRLGARKASTLTVAAARVSQLDLARGTVTLAAESIAGILPGIVVDGLTAVDVEHEVSAKGGLRTRIWGKHGAGTSRFLAAYKAIIDQLDPDRAFRGVTEYRVVTQDGERLNLQPVRRSTGMPDLARVVVRPGVPGAKASHKLGSRVLVGFVDADPARPAVVGFEDAEGGGFVTPTLTLNADDLEIGTNTKVHFATPLLSVLASDIELGSGAASLAFSAGVLTAFVAVEAWADALNGALQVPGATVSSVASAMVTPTATLNAAITAAATAVPTIVVKGA